MTDAETPDPLAALRNIVLTLQDNPAAYKFFGIYWWVVKAMLLAAGYTREQLYMLGTYVDPETAALVPVGNLDTTLRAALAEYGQNARYPRSGGRVEDTDGQVVTIYDPDVGQ